MVLYFIGIGLCDEKDITLRGLEVIESADKIYLESYTAILSPNANIEKVLGKKTIIEADRKFIEEGSDIMLDEATNQQVVLLVVGDPLCATTHSDLMLRAYEKNIQVEIIHNASIISAIGATGLQVYKFGETVSIPFFDNNWQPESFYDKVKLNMKQGLHTLCLLDIKVKEQSLDNMMRNLPIFESPRYMNINQAIKQLYIIEKKRNERVALPSTLAFGVARIGSKNQLILAGTLEQLSSVDFGEPLHSLVLCHPELHLIEKKFFEIANKRMIDQLEARSV
ncbi:diphthine synthase family protein [Cryptosporidium muris RN66]|uniref:diphthine methyl ester synthase n=1 Tax=Cryptosporidium muris (strain RN66) TaxID=441375 RepID=B6ADU6_CRYMR|nr:diphthine synthase family protein [Cryptosporidium muris RN66]EEA06387.1 diphthine synthase family protein [Cryptosporidium muris RN66]|eukprot:XP_002140736.1 diphthine synthase family protein [Cryptosporidium muris RN66]